MVRAGYLRWPAASAAVALLAGSWALAAPTEEARPISQVIREGWTYRDGLPHNLAHRVLAARSGYLWVGTQEGLVRFDGVRFRTFSRIDTPGLAGDEINALLDDPQGTLWIGTASGLSRLSGDVFEVVEPGQGFAVSALAPDGEGGVWVGTPAAGVWRVRRGAGRPEQVAATAGRDVVTLQPGAGGRLWLGGRGWLARLAGGHLEEVERAGLGSRSVAAVLEDADGTVWVGTSVGLFRRPPGAALAPVRALREQSIFALLRDGAGDLWIGSRGPLQRMRGERVEPVAGPGGPADAHTLAEDAAGDVWVGTESGGLQRLRWGQVVTLGREEGLSADGIWAVMEGRDGTLWFTGDGGLDRMRGGPPRRAHADLLRGTQAAALLEDRAGRLWVGTAEGGVFRLDERGTARYGAAAGLPHAMVRVLHEDVRGTIWAGTNGGLFRLEGERFAPVTPAPGAAAAVVNALAEGADGTLWVGTTAGLARVQGGVLAPLLAAGLSGREDVAALRADADGALWLGTVGDGLKRLQGSQVLTLTRREGLHEDTVLGILDDGLGHLWLSGNHGITRLARADVEALAPAAGRLLRPTILGRADGMRDRECNGGVQPSAWRAADGRLWFATIRGAVVVDPARFQPNPQPPQARVEELLADGQPRPLGEPLRLEPGTRRVDIRYTGLALAAAERVRFRYRLEGLEAGFVDAGSERTAHYTNLAPGRYTFRVVAANENGLWGAADASVAFVLQPHLWQAGWFRAAVAAALLALAWAVHLARTRRLRRREAELTARVAEEMGKVKLLTGLLPICAWCKRIRTDAGAWQSVETYLASRTEAKFTHGMCPECYARQEHGG